MPYCDVTGNGSNIFYRSYGFGSTKILLIIGLAATYDAWLPQIKGLTGSVEPNDEEPIMKTESKTAGSDDEEGQQQNDGIEVCCFDNRGVGKSFVPTKKYEYTTTIMAKDALALMDHLGWRKAHIFGHSMGGMIACKLAAIAPGRVCSLAMLNVTGGGYQCIPKIDRQMISIAFRFLRAKTPEQRALVDLDTHFSQEYLDEFVGSSTRRSILFQDYVKAITSSGMQSSHGFEGQLNACWNHCMTSRELKEISSSGFLVSVIHGRYDVIAQLNHARRLAEKLKPAARMVEIHGGHLVSRERPDEVNLALLELIRATKMKVMVEEWSRFPENQLGITGVSTSLSLMSSVTDIFLVLYRILGKLQFSFLYLAGLIVIGCQYLKDFLISRSARVAALESIR